ncbi:hypothetical protein KCP69_10135 [Salmonella enterica subsp. enterica]|nr:hypothetical protein KCP69_10135 [Salmonella enterica subsp. enterica]
MVIPALTLSSSWGFFPPLFQQISRCNLTVTIDAGGTNSFKHNSVRPGGQKNTSSRARPKSRADCGDQKSHKLRPTDPFGANTERHATHRWRDNGSAPARLALRCSGIANIDISDLFIPAANIAADGLKRRHPRAPTLRWVVRFFTNETSLRDQTCKLREKPSFPGVRRETAKANGNHLRGIPTVKLTYRNSLRLTPR